MPILGDGGPVYTGPELSPNPTSLECGALLDATARDFEILLRNTGDSDLEIFDIVITGAEITLPTFTPPETITPGTSFSLVVRVTPSGLGADSGSLLVVSNAINNPTSIAITWTGVAAGVVSLTVDPTDWEFPNTKVGSSSTEKVFTITNTGSVNVTVNAPTFPANFAAGATLPAYPVIVAPSATLDFGVIFSPTVSAGYFTQSVLVNSTAAATPFTLTMSGMAFLITSAYSVTLGQEGFMFAFALESDTEVREMDWSDFDTEEECRWQKLHNFALLGADKLLALFGHHYEDHGECEVEWTFTNQVTGASVVVTRTIGTVAANQKVLLDIFELDPPLEGENIVVQCVKAAGDGKLFITDYLFKFDPFKEAVGTTANPASITSVFTVSSNEEVILIGFPSTVRQLDSEDFECETEAVIGNSMLYPFPSEAGAIPGFVYEKMVARVYFHYEDHGEAVVTVRVISMRGQISEQDVTIGTAGAALDVQMGVADIHVTDEIVRVEFEPVSGPFFLVDHTVAYEVSAERKKTV